MLLAYVEGYLVAGKSFNQVPATHPWRKHEEKPASCIINLCRKTKNNTDFPQPIPTPPPTRPSTLSSTLSTTITSPQSAHKDRDCTPASTSPCSTYEKTSPNASFPDCLTPGNPHLPRNQHHHHCPRPSASRTTGTSRSWPSFPRGHRRHPRDVLFVGG